MMYRNSFTGSDIFRLVNWGTLATSLEMIRKPILKLSESDICKHEYFTLKKHGLIGKIKESDGRRWNLFSLLEVMVLSVVKFLWKHNVENEKIKKVVEELTKADDIQGIFGTINIEDVNAKYGESNSDEKSDLFTYFHNQKKINPHLPVFSTMEAIIIGVIKLNRPSSFLLYEDGELEFFTTSEFTDKYSNDYFNKIFSKHSFNISINEIVAKILCGNAENTETAQIQPNNTIVQKLSSIGYDRETINQLYNRNEDISFVEESLKTDISIEKTLREKSNQDLVIKIRDGKKVSMRRLVIINNK